MDCIPTIPVSSRKRFFVVVISLSVALLVAGAMTFSWQRLMSSTDNAAPVDEATPYLGVTYVPLSHDVAARYNVEAGSGVLITDVTDGSPAWWAGLRRGDVALAIDSTSITLPSQLLELLRYGRPGDRVTVQLLRDGKTISAEVVLAARPPR